MSGWRRFSPSRASWPGDFNLAFPPERVDPGRTDVTMPTTPRSVGGLTPACGDRAEALYREVCDTIVRVATPKAAELAKLLETSSAR